MLQIHSYFRDRYKDCIERIWIAENQEIREMSVVIPPSQFVDLLIPLGGNGFYHNAAHFSTPHLEGVNPKPVLFKILPSSKLMGVRFYGCGMYPFDNLQGKDILGKIIHYPLKEGYHEKIKEEYRSGGEGDKLDALYELFDAMYDANRYQEICVINKFYKQLTQKDTYPQLIKEFCHENKTNYTSLRRTFNKVIGLSTKKVERLIKFRKALEKLLSAPEKLSSVGIDSGYFDQSHFIKEFKYYMEMSPTEYLAFIQEKDRRKIIEFINFTFV